MTKIDINLKDTVEFSNSEILDLEKESLGFYVSGHPLDKYRETLDEINYTLSSQVDELADGSEALIVGKLENIVYKVSKKGNKFGIGTIMDLHGNIELMMFESHLKELEEDFDTNKPIAFKVRAKVNDFGTQLAIKKIESLKDAKKEKLKKVTTKIEAPLEVSIDYTDDEQILYQVFEIISQNQGKRPVQLTIKSKLGDVIIDSGYYINKNAVILLKAFRGVDIK